MAKQTQSSRLIGISFPNELAKALSVCAQQQGSSFPWIVRAACGEYLAARGFDVSGIPNPAGRGVRSDLQKLPSVPESSRRPARKGVEAS